MLRSRLSELGRFSKSRCFASDASSRAALLYDAQALRGRSPHLSYHVASTDVIKRFLSTFRCIHAGRSAHESRNAGPVLAKQLQDPTRSSLTPAEVAVFTRIGIDAAERQTRYAQSEEGAIKRLIEGENGEVLAVTSLEELFDQARANTSRAFKARVKSLLEASQRQDFTRQSLLADTILPSSSALLAHRGDAHPSYHVSGEREAGRSQFTTQIANLNATPHSTSKLLPRAGRKGAQESPATFLRQTQSVQKQLENASTDVEIWETLQSRVFSQVQRFNDKLDAAKKSAKSFVRKKSKRGEVERREATVPYDIGTIGSMDIVHNLPRETEAPLFLKAIQLSYAHLCWIALRRLRERFPQSPYATAILPAIKSLGPRSYVLGASTELYNEALILNWAYYRNPHACADLRAEMLDRGIPSNMLTLSVFREAAKRWLHTRTHSKVNAQAELGLDDSKTASESVGSQKAGVAIQAGETLSAFELAWWALEGTSSGFKRWQALEMEARERQEEDKRHQAEAQREAEFDEAEGGERPGTYSY